MAACSSTPKTLAPAAPPPVMAVAPPTATPTAAQPAATPDLAPRQRMLRVLKLLGDGQAEQARAEIVAFLAEQPGNSLGTSLLEQIDRDPKALLGTQSFTYRTQPGETLSSIAEKFLGDRLLFYALARYNGIAAPARMEVGQVLQIPGSAPRATAPRRAPRAVSDEAAVEARVAETRTAPRPPPAARRDPQGAARLRRAGLDKMQAGSIDAAVQLLEQALQLDPDSAAIKADLERGRRIQATVRRR